MENSFYRFPAIPTWKTNHEEQLDKIIEEANEAKESFEEWEAECDVPSSVHNVTGWEPVKKARHAFGMELMDVIHATESELRKVFKDEELEQLRDEVIAKNEARKYYTEDD